MTEAERQASVALCWAIDKLNNIFKENEPMLFWNNEGEIRCGNHLPPATPGSWKEMPPNISRGNPKLSCDICRELAKPKVEQPKEFTGPVTTIARDTGYGNQ